MLLAGLPYYNIKYNCICFGKNLHITISIDDNQVSTFTVPSISNFNVYSLLYTTYTEIIKFTKMHQFKFYRKLETMINYITTFIEVRQAK